MPFLISPFLTLPLTLLTLLVLSSVPAYAEWVTIAYSDSLGGYTTYADPGTLRRKGNLVKIWSLVRLQGGTTRQGRFVYLGKNAVSIRLHRRTIPHPFIL